MRMTHDSASGQTENNGSLSMMRYECFSATPAPILKRRPLFVQLLNWAPASQANAAYCKDGYSTSSYRYSVTPQNKKLVLCC